MSFIRALQGLAWTLVGVLLVVSFLFGGAPL